MKATRLFFIVLGAAAALQSSSATLTISPDRVVNWIPGVTVGVLQQIPNRTTIVDVTKAPYNADKTGHIDASVAINQAINAAGFFLYGSNTVIYLPTGNYKVTSPINITKSDITLRGDGQGKTFVNAVGNTEAVSVGTSGNVGTYSVIGGATKGSQNVQIQLPQGFQANTYGWLSVGDLCSIGEQPRTVSDPFHVFSPAYGLQALNAMNYVTAISGNNITLALPLPVDLTNSPIFSQFTYNSMGGLQCVSGVGLEGISFTMTNPPTHEIGVGPEIVEVITARNFWMTNCEVAYANQHFALFGLVVGATISGCMFDTAQATGSGHGGMVTAITGGLIENNIFANMYTSGIELDGGSDCAFFGNYFTNTGWCVDMHGTHPYMQLFEQNVSSDTLETDDYFGSCSHFTLFRNSLSGGGYLPLRFNRWSRFMTVVGNILGQPTTVGGSWNYQMDENSQSFPAIFSFGLPNIGNQFFAGAITDDSSWNYPGTNYFDYALTERTIPYTPFKFTSKQGPTNVFWGNFAATGIRPYSSVLRLIFQDNVNTNVYHTITTGDGVYPLSITSSNMTINTTYTVSNGWTMYVGGAVGYQQVQATDKLTHMITGNYDYYHNSQIWDANGPQTILPSILYPGGKPSYWGTNIWPAINPASPSVPMIPAFERYLNLPVGNTGGGGGNKLSAPILLPAQPVP